MEQAIAQIAIMALPIVLAITLHEAAHGYAARHFGDPTAYQAGRISLNPLRHVDPVGTLLVPALIYFTTYSATGGGMLFGWAKPVPVDFGRLRHPKRDMFWVAAAGPLANLAMAAAWALLGKAALVAPQTGYTLAMRIMADAGIQINAVLMILNLLPIPPLDGGRIAVSLLPHRLAWRYARIEPWGFPLLLLLLFTGVLGVIMWPLVTLFRYAIAVIFQL